MLSAAKTPGSDDWWLLRLATAKGADFRRMGRLRDHYDGTIDVPDGSIAPMREVYRRFTNLGRHNVARLIVQAVTSRMIPRGATIRGRSSAEEDAAVQAVWDDSRMDLQMRELATDLAVYGTGTAVVHEDGTIVRQDPWTVITETDPSRPWEVLAALVLAWDPVAQADQLTLFVRDDDGSIWWRRASHRASISAIPSTGVVWTPGKSWQWDFDRVRIDWASRIPVVPLTAPGGLGQFEPHLDGLDRINHKAYDQLVILVMQAFRQRAIKGELPDVYPDDDPLGRAGQPINYDEIFSSGPAALWRLPQGAEIWESTVTDITPLTTDIDKEIRHLLAESSTPLYAFTPDAVSGSAEGASLARETLVYKVEDLDARAGVGTADAVALALAARGLTPTGAVQIGWMPADRPSLTERYTIATQAGAAPPRHATWREVLGWTPDQIEVADQELMDQQLMEVGDAGSRSSVEPQRAAQQ